MYMMEKLNELRQVKDSVFNHDVSNKKDVISIEELCNMYPNDADLGSEIRILIKNQKQIK